MQKLIKNPPSDQVCTTSQFVVKQLIGNLRPYEINSSWPVDMVLPISWSSQMRILLISP
jgi:hypothetical protein